MDETAMPVRFGARLVRFVRGAPLTFSWLAVLALTTLVQHSLPGRQLHDLLIHESTNLHHLASEPIRVLIASLLWIDGFWWWPYLIMYCIFLVPAERWLGSLRWLAVGLLAHVIATYIGEGALYWAIQEAIASPRLIHARDVGVSYFLAGMIGVLTYRFVRPWRWVYLAGILLTFGTLLALKVTFTGIGHFSAVLVGLACYPLTLGRNAPLWDPLRELRSRVSRRRNRPSSDPGSR